MKNLFDNQRLTADERKKREEEKREIAEINTGGRGSIFLTI